MNGMEEMAESLAFLRSLRHKLLSGVRRWIALRTALIGCGKVGQIQAEACGTCPSRRWSRSPTAIPRGLKLRLALRCRPFTDVPT